MRPVLLLVALLSALLAGLAATAILIQPPSVRSSSQAGEFNAARAGTRLAAILGDEQPHPADTAAADAVRARLVGQIRALGLTPIVRDQFACNTIYKTRGVTCARVRNVIVQLGPAGGKALLLNSHYDSNPTGPGAGDAGVGVATLLEVASILKTERLERPLLFLFNEGEELGLVGARAFLADPLSRNVDSLINLEARGTTGPVSMFETSVPNGPAVRAFARSVDRPFANSLATDFYRQMPNYTDVNSFSERGWTTLNFAMIGNETRYHSAGDTLAALDPRSLQHMGDQTLAVARTLAGASPSRGGNLLFADLAGRELVVIPQWLGFLALGLLVIGFASIAWRRGGLWRGLAVFFAALVASGALAWLGLYLMRLAQPGTFWRAEPLWTHLAVYACGVLAAVAALALIGRRLTVAQLRTSFWLGLLALGVAALLIAPGGVIYFLLPPLVAIAGIQLSRRWPRAEVAGAIAAAILLWLTFGEVLALLGELLSNGPLFILAPLAMLLAMPWLIEARSLIDDVGRWPAIGTAALLMLLGWGAAAAASAYSADRQQRFTIQHVTDAVGGRAYWSVLNDRARLPDNYGGTIQWRWDELPYIERKRWIAPAPAAVGMQSPRLRLLSETRRGDSRTVTLQIEPNGAETVTLIGDKDAGLGSAGSGAFVRPFAADTEGEYYLTCFGRSCDGAAIRFTSARPQRLGFTLVGSRRGLPQAAKPLVEQRPRFARPQYSPDSTVTLARVRI
jgi:hypothetical protein